MNESGVKPYTEFVLPSSVATKSDIARLVTEMERVDNEMTAASIGEQAHAANPPQVTPPSDALQAFIDANQISLDESRHRTELIKQLRELKEKVPVVHLTFATTADRDSLQQIIQWLRGSAHPQSVVVTGIQPELVAGVHVRTTNHVYDLSLRAMFRGRHDQLVQELESLSGGN